ncbi:MAG: metallophosphoesterase [Rhizobiales bacterium]|nr:metallophosphoesterase [Hyphomicrobiales bacterium]
MRPIVDPREGDLEDDASSTKSRTLISLAGSLLAEISLPKLLVAWTILIGLPVLIVGLAPFLISIWLRSLSAQAVTLFTGFGPPLLLILLGALGWWGGRRLLRLMETNFWSLNALAVQPSYALAREVLRHFAERPLGPDTDPDRLDRRRAWSAAGAGVIVCLISILIIIAAWPYARWIGALSDLASPGRLVTIAVCNSVVVLSAYVAVAALAWGFADALMPQPRDLAAFAEPTPGARVWRIAHLSDIHIVGERYGFRLESGRSGPRGNDRLRRALAALAASDRERPVDVVLVSGDVTDAGRSSEWAEFLDQLQPYPELAARLVAIPGNHDLNIVDRANPARLDLPTSPNRKLRQLRALSAFAALQGDRVHVVSKGATGPRLDGWVESYRADVERFVDSGAFRVSGRIEELWTAAYPMVLPPTAPDGLGVILMNSNAEAHFSFTNALGLVTHEQAQAVERVVTAWPDAGWALVLHHHVVEYARAGKRLSERVGTALANGTWFVRHLLGLSGRIVVMHGHRHVDWIGSCGGMLIVSAPSPVMNARDDEPTYFYIQNIEVRPGGRVALLEPDRIDLPGETPEPTPGRQG